MMFRCTLSLTRSGNQCGKELAASYFLEQKAPADWSRVKGRHAWKPDFNQCTERHLIAAIQAGAGVAVFDAPLPFVLIWRSKLFSRF